MPGQIEIYPLPKFPLHLTAESQAIVIVTSGQGEISVDTQLILLQSLKLICCNGARSIVAAGEINGTILVFDSSYQSGNSWHDFQNGNRIIVIDINPNQSLKLRAIMRLMVYELVIDIRRTYLKLVLQYIAEVSDHVVFHPVINRLLDLVDRYYLIERRPDYYAQQIGMTTRALNKLSKRVTGKIILDWLTKRKFEEARHLLTRTELGIKEIAYELNFTDQSHFAKFLKKYNGSSPKQLRFGK